MKTINVNLVYNYLKTKKHIIAAIFIGLLITIFIFNIVSSKIQQEKIKKVLLLELESAKAILEENQELIFFNSASIEVKQKKHTISSEIEFLRKELDQLKTFDECIENQLNRLANNQIVDLEYCNNFSDEIEEIEEIKEVPVKKEVQKIKVDHKTDDEVIKIAIEFIKSKEGVRYVAYPDYGQYSICYGNKSRKGATATQEECDKLLLERVQSELLRINRQADGIGGNKKAALISFFYNVGYKANVLNYAARGDDKSVVYLISLYTYADGNFLPWLQKRRQAEIKLYNK